MASRHVEELRHELEDSVLGEVLREAHAANLDASAQVGADAAGAAFDTRRAICASYRREERLQYRFMVFYQTLVAVLAVLSLLLLMWAAYQTFRANPDGVTGVLAGLCAIATGAGAGFLVTQRKDARDAYEAAQLALNEANCR